MDNKDIFNTPEEEIKRLISEIQDLKELMRDLSSRLSRIETRVKRAFPSSFWPISPKKDGSSKVAQQPSLSEQQAKQLYEEMVEYAKRGEREKVHERLRGLALSDLSFLRKELGASIKQKKSSRKAIMESIIGRINESVMLAKHANRQELIDNSDPAQNLDEENKKNKI